MGVRRPVFLATGCDAYGFTITLVSVVAGGVVSITWTPGLALITLTSFTTASSSMTVVTPIVFETRSTARSLMAGVKTDPRRTTVLSA